jgi:hypothetical protein
MVSSHRHRRRRTISGGAVPFVAPLFRYSVSRRAYVLRVVGGRFGPVLRVGEEPASDRTGRFQRSVPPAELEPIAHTRSGDASRSGTSV